MHACWQLRCGLRLRGDVWWRQRTKRYAPSLTRSPDHTTPNHPHMLRAPLSALPVLVCLHISSLAASCAKNSHLRPVLAMPQIRKRLGYKAKHFVGRAPVLESDSDYIMETRHLTALTRPPQGTFLCHVSVSRGGPVLIPDKDVSGLLDHGSGYVGVTSPGGRSLPHILSPSPPPPKPLSSPHPPPPPPQVAPIVPWLPSCPGF